METQTEDDDNTVQLGARVDRTLKQLVKGLVKHKHGKVRGPLGESYEQALEYLLAVHILQNKEDFDAIIEKSKCEDEQKARERLNIAVDNAGPDLLGVKQAIEEASRASQQPQPTQPQEVEQTPEEIAATGVFKSSKDQWEQSTIRKAALGSRESPRADNQLVEKLVDELSEELSEDALLDKLAERMAEKSETN